MGISGILKKYKPIKKSSGLRFTRSKAGKFFVFLFLFLAGLFSMLPLIYCIVTSFKPIDELMIFPPRFFVKRPTVVNFVALPDLLSNLDIPLARYVINSLGVSIVSTVIYIIFSSMAAFSLSKSSLKCKNFLFWVIQFALMFNAYTLSVPQYLIFAKTGIIDTYWVYILPYLATTLGVFLVKQYMEGYVADAFIEAARIDGASYYKIFWTIVMPLIKPAWLTLALFSFRDTWAMVPNGTIFSEELKTLPQIAGQITAGGIARAGSAMAITTIMMIPPIAVYLISQSSVVEAMSSAGIKE